MDFICGEPWKDQHIFNSSDNSDITGWTSSGTLPYVSGNNLYAITKNRAYVIGGNNSGGVAINTIQFATISAGVISNFSYGGVFPYTIYGGRIIVLGNNMYTIGGRYDSGMLDYTAHCIINTDGTLGTWTLTQTIPDANGIVEAMVFVTKNRIYAVGGGFMSPFRSLSFTAPIDSDGMIGTWLADSATDLPTAISDAAVVITPSKVYILGGYLAGYYLSNAIYSATINTDGTINAWQNDGTLPFNARNQQVVNTKNAAFLIGGYYTGDTRQLYVYRSPIDNNGNLGSWTRVTDMGYSTSAAATLITSSRIYILGGMTPNGINTIYYANFVGGKDDYSFDSQPGTSFSWMRS